MEYRLLLSQAVWKERSRQGTCNSEQETYNMLPEVKGEQCRLASLESTVGMLARTGSEGRREMREHCDGVR